jgi:hypothetical protein
MGTAWERHGMCESALKELYKMPYANLIKIYGTSRHVIKYITKGTVEDSD